MKDVVIGIVSKDEKILMIKRARVEGDLEYTFPGGKVELGETKEQAVIREVKEETGINVKVKKILGERIHPNTLIKLTYFICDYFSGDLAISDYNEIKEAKFLTKDEFNNCVKTDVYEPVKKYIKKYIK